MALDPIETPARPHRVPAVGVVDGVTEARSVDDGQVEVDSGFLKCGKRKRSRKSSQFYSHAHHHAIVLNSIIRYALKLDECSHK